jgi:hypothetical protein
MEQLEETGLLSKQKLLAGALPGDLSETHDLTSIEERAGRTWSRGNRPSRSRPKICKLDDSVC